MMEYVLLVGIVVTVLFAMTMAIKRSAQSLIKVAADEIGVQQNADQSFDRGYLDTSYTNEIGINKKSVNEYAGVINYILDDHRDMQTTTITNMGFTEER